ncbi:ras-like GTP-binding protein RhoL [Nilaparvata lugens]|uniref:ras-like GTP-binding protein RhoL n=1 Tax=Nilaparvata lugens TaxID=108931 RepID=UPI000B99B41F|nr:ras-like GTP-binding protein RhoL [Nilaparvata lugens]
MRLKLTVIGDGTVGKTCLLITYTRRAFPTEYVPTVFETLPLTISVDGESYEVNLWDTAGQEEYEKLRLLCYPHTNCFIMCYSVPNRSSFDNILTKWHPEVKKMCPGVPVLLVATKTDIRTADRDSVSAAEGEKMRKRIKAAKFIECSALSGVGLEDVFQEAVKLALGRKQSHDCVFI